jgi:hypothetical protein
VGQVSVAYGVNLKNSLGMPIANGSIIPVGTILDLTPVPFTNSDISWFLTGSASDSPYGFWINGATVSPMNDIVGDNIYMEVALYAGASFNPPTVSLSKSGTANLSCVGFICTVTSPGTIAADVAFSNTYGYFYASDEFDEYLRLNPAISVPARTFSFALTAIPASIPPTIPVITGPTSGNVNNALSFSMTATDPDNDTLRYLIDWDNDGIIDGIVPAGYVTSGTMQSASRSWSTTGSKTFQVQAEDVNGSKSGFAQHTIVLNDPVNTFTCAWPSSNFCDLKANCGKTYTLTATCLNGLNASVATSNCGATCVDKTNNKCDACPSPLKSTNWKEVSP